ncbi:MAG: hypothetical protein H0U85_00040 [Gemmatimonadales bacterium]|nr:hypothetical protein [Gemmatimonadales bacterium]
MADVFYFTLPPAALRQLALRLSPMLPPFSAARAPDVTSPPSLTARAKAAVARLVADLLGDWSGNKRRTP